MGGTVPVDSTVLRKEEEKKLGVACFIKKKEYRTYFSCTIVYVHFFFKFITMKNCVNVQ